jgi:hypothetical protein
LKSSQRPNSPNTSSKSPVVSKYYPTHNRFTQPLPKSPTDGRVRADSNGSSKGSPKFIRSPSVVQVCFLLYYFFIFIVFTGFYIYIYILFFIFYFYLLLFILQFVKQLTGPQLSEMQTLFNHYDADKDGRIDYSSVRSIVKEINPSIDSNGNFYFSLFLYIKSEHKVLRRE